MENPTDPARQVSEEVKAVKKAQQPSVTISLEGLRWIIRLRYRSEGLFARQTGRSPTTVSRLLSGTWIPQEPKTIARLAQDLAIDPVILTQFFERMRPEPVLMTAEQIEKNTLI